MQRVSVRDGSPGAHRSPALPARRLPRHLLVDHNLLPFVAVDSNADSNGPNHLRPAKASDRGWSEATHEEGCRRTACTELVSETSAAEASAVRPGPGD